MFGVVYCGTLLSKGGKLFFPIQVPYDTTIILEHFVCRAVEAVKSDVNSQMSND
jgi:hypothetical protein